MAIYGFTGFTEGVGGWPRLFSNALSAPAYIFETYVIQVLFGKITAPPGL